jgi:hypothetical protein
VCCFVRVACHVARDVFGCSLGLLAGLSGVVYFPADQLSLYFFILFLFLFYFEEKVFTGQGHAETNLD